MKISTHVRSSIKPLPMPLTHYEITVSVKYNYFNEQCPTTNISYLYFLFGEKLPNLDNVSLLKKVFSLMQVLDA